MIVRRTAAAALVPPAEPAVLLITFDFAINAHDFMALVYRPFEIGRRDPVIMEIDAHAIGEIHPYLDGVIGIDALADQPLFLSHRGQRDRLGLIIMPNQIDPMRPHVTKRIALLGPLEGAGRD